VASRHVRSAVVMIGMLGLATYAVAIFPSADAPPPALPHYPSVITTPRLAVTFPGEHVSFRSREYPNELQAYADLVRLRTRASPEAKPFVSIGESGRPAITLELPNNLLEAVPIAQRLRADSEATDSDWMLTRPDDIRQWQEESMLLDRAYSNLPFSGTGNLESASASIVADILTLSRVYGIPLRLFRPAGENSLQTVQWKRHPAADEVVLLRVPGAQLVTDNDAIRWQEIRSALTQAHYLYWRSGSASSRVPQCLRPPTELSEDVAPRALFTYSAILIRDLIDKAGGDDPRLLSAYTDRPDNPNVRHDVGVRRAAFYARRLLAYAFAINRAKLTAELRNPSLRQR
jgi:hypothetical protein